MDVFPLNEDGSLKEIQIYGKKYKGRELYDVLETYVRRAFFAVDSTGTAKRDGYSLVYLGKSVVTIIWQG